MSPKHTKFLLSLAAPAAMFIFAAPAAVLADEESAAAMDENSAVMETTQTDDDSDVQGAAENTEDTTKAEDPAEEAEDEIAADTDEAEDVNQESSAKNAAEDTTQDTTESEDTSDTDESALPDFDASNTIDSSTSSDDVQTIIKNLTGSLLLDNVDLSGFNINTSNNVYIKGNVLLNSLTTNNSGVYGYDNDSSKDILTISQNYNANGAETRIKGVDMELTSDAETQKFGWSGVVTIEDSVVNASNATGVIGCGFYATPAAQSMIVKNSTIIADNNYWCGFDTTNGNTNALFRFFDSTVDISNNTGNGFQSNYNADGSQGDSPQIVFTNTNVTANKNGYSSVKAYSAFSYTTIYLENTDGGNYTFEANDNAANGVGGHKEKQSSLRADGYTIIASNNGDTGIKQNDGIEAVIKDSTVIATGNKTAGIAYANDTKPVFEQSDVTGQITYEDEKDPDFIVTVQFIQDGKDVGTGILTMKNGDTIITKADLEAILPEGTQLPDDFTDLTYPSDFTDKSDYYPDTISITLKSEEKSEPEKPDQPQKPEKPSKPEKPDVKPADKTESVSSTKASGVQTAAATDQVLWQAAFAGGTIGILGLFTFKKSRKNK